MFIVLTSIIEAIYVLYILRFYKTTRSLSIYDIPLYGTFKHTNNNTITPTHHICPFGQDSAILLFMYLIIRAIRLYYKKKWNWKLNVYLNILIFIISLINFNALVYLLPYYLTEIIIKNNMPYNQL